MLTVLEDHGSVLVLEPGEAAQAAQANTTTVSPLPRLCSHELCCLLPRLSQIWPLHTVSAPSGYISMVLASAYIQKLADWVH